MFRIAVCFMLLAGTVTNALADDDVSTGISNKQTLPKSYVIELTRLVMKDSASNSVAGLSGSRLDAQIRQWRESDQIASDESLSLTSVENFAASAQFGRRVAVYTGASRFDAGRSSIRQAQWMEIGTIVQATITSRADHVIAELTCESTQYVPNEDENAPGETLSITISTHLILKPGERQVISNSRTDDRTVLLVEVSEIGQARATRRTPSPRSTGGRRPDPRRTSPSPSVTGTQDRLERFVQAMFKRYDKNGDGVIDEDESEDQSGSTFLRGRFRDLDLDENNKLTSSELSKFFQQRAPSAR
jgi:hypothetical protein